MYLHNVLAEPVIVTETGRKGWWISNRSVAFSPMEPQTVVDGAGDQGAEIIDLRQPLKYTSAGYPINTADLSVRSVVDGSRSLPTG